MRKRLLLTPLAALTLLAACSDNDRSSRSMDPTTAAVLGLAASTSEVAEPFPVNDGAYTFNDTAEDTTPLPVAP